MMKKLFNSTIARARVVFFVVSLVVPSAALADALPPPAVNLLSAPAISPADAWTYYGSSTTHTNGIAASIAAPEISELARTLGAGRLTATQYAQNIDDYIRNNIDVEFRFGLGKGGRGAIIDQSGTPFDQAETSLVKLLRAGGVTAGYQIGTITLSAQQFGPVDWTY